MRTLSLFRHAKSSWSKKGLQDFDRPLNARGLKAAPAMGAYMAQHAILPDLILCSTAKRTIETLELALQAFPAEPEVRYDDTLYLASPSEILKRVKSYGMDFPHIMVIAHNPGIHACALRLAGEGPDDAMAALAAKFPTAALAVIDFPSASWRDIKDGEGRLRLFMVPKAL